MGRGRAKAKQTKVARRLKYQTFDTDFEALQQELSASQSSESAEGEDYDGEDDDYGHVDSYDSYDEDEDDRSRARR